MLKSAFIFMVLASLGCTTTGTANEGAAPAASSQETPSGDLPDQVVGATTEEAKPSPAPPSKKASPKTKIRDVELKYSKAKTFQADVTKTLKLKMLERETSLDGQIELKKPSKFRLEFTKPEPSMIITDGKTLWMVTPPADPDFDNTTRVIRTKNLGKIQSQAMVTFLLGKGRLLKEFQLEDESHADGKAKFVLSPREKGDIEKAELLVQDATKEILEIRYWDRLQNETRLVFRNGKFNKPISNGHFTYAPPTGAEIEDL